MRATWVFAVILLVVSIGTVSAGTGDGVTFNDVKWEYKGGFYRYVTAYTGENIIPHALVHSKWEGDVIIKFEWCENVPLAPDKVVKVITASAYATHDEMDLDISNPYDPATSLTPGKFFVRVYVWVGPSSEPEFVQAHLADDTYWKRIDPWTNPISNPDRPEVTFVEPTTPTPTPSQPTGTLIASQWKQNGKYVFDEIVADTPATVEVFVETSNFAGGTITVEVREDIVFSPDKMVASNTVSVSEDGVIMVPVTFTVPSSDLTNLRGVFVKVYGYKNGFVNIYDETDPTKRFNDKTEIKVVAPTTPITPTPTTPTPTYPAPTTTYPTPTATYPYLPPSETYNVIGALLVVLTAAGLAWVLTRKKL